MALLQSRWIDLSNVFIFTGDVEVPTPLAGPQAANKNYVDSTILSSTSSFKTVDIVYTGTNLTHKVLQIPDVIDVSTSVNRLDILVSPVSGILQDYGTDYTVRAVGTTSYICLDPTSTPVSGSFDGGGDNVNPSVGITNLVQSGDTVRVLYKIGNTTIFSSSVVDELNLKQWFGL